MRAHSLAYTYVKEQTTAEDITQEVFVKCYMKLDSFKGIHPPFSCFPYRVQVHLGFAILK
ncbi:sigma factor [Pseudalkalibacillus sp. A8]|uniref:sigma factor n=1 Tax=Pseudalkalibacillus sp. A8 TaxID=3382641 RepID=UPI0038B47C69